jgi:hypothetical protein
MAAAIVQNRSFYVLESVVVKIGLNRRELARNQREAQLGNQQTQSTQASRNGPRIPS